MARFRPRADRGSAILAANGPDRRVGGIGPFWLQSTFWSDSAHAAIGTVRGHLGRLTIGLLVSCIAERHSFARRVASGVAFDP